MSQENRHMLNYQSGVKYRTICAKCNGGLLGKYDKVYADFIERITKRINEMAMEVKEGKKEYPISTIVSIDVQINKVLRSIIGHFLSMKSEYVTESSIEDNMREYLENEELKLKDLKLFSWFYPYRTVLNLRDAATAGFLNSENGGTHPKGTISVMNAFPLAYLLSTEDEYECNIDDLGELSTSSIDDVVTVPFHIRTAYYSYLINTEDEGLPIAKKKSFLWPVNISSKEYGAKFVLSNDSDFEGGTIAVQR